MASDSRKETSIFDRATTCKYLFEQYLADPLRNAKDASRLIYQYERYNRWAGHLGVMAPARLSLDDRLHAVEDMRDWVLELLEVLEINLNDHVHASSTSVADQSLDEKPASTENPSLAHAAFEGIQESLNRLHWLGNVIRKSSTSQLASRVSKFVSKQGDGERFAERMRLLLVRGLYPNITDSFAQQLARSISFRRQRLLYQKDREKVIEKPRDNAMLLPNKSPIMGEMTQEKEEDVLPIESGYREEAAYQPVRPDPSAPSTERASTVDPVQLQFNLENQAPVVLPDDVKSVTSIAHNNSYPKPPKWSRDRERLCQCDWCFQELPYTQEEDQWSRAWRSHFDEDLEPYVCISEACSERLMYFVSRTEWRKHMDEFHSSDWTQEIHKQDTWFCASDQHSFQQFQSPAHLRAHMMKEHKGTLKTEDLETMIKRNVLPKPRGASECPLCGQDGTVETGAAIPGIQQSIVSAASVDQEGAQMKKVQFQMTPGYIDPDVDGSEESRHPASPLGEGAQSDEKVQHLKLTRHIALHLKSLSFASLRYFDDEDASSEKSRDAALGVRNSREGSSDQYDHDSELEDVSLTFEDLGPQEQDDFELANASMTFGSEELDEVDDRRSGILEAEPDMSSISQKVNTQRQLKNLEIDVRDALMENCFGKGKFLPCDQLDTFVSREIVTSIVNGDSGLHFSEEENLVNFILQGARRLFLILVLVTQDPERLNSFLSEVKSNGLVDKFLPIDFWEENTVPHGIGTSATDFELFGRWSDLDLDLFDTNQWMLLAPVFQGDPFRHKFHVETILPYLVMHENEGDTFSDPISRVEIHKAHVPHLTARFRRDRIFIAMKQSRSPEDLGDFFDEEAKTLRSLCGYQSPHILRPFAAYQMAGARYLLLPWPNRGNLRNYWTKNERQRSDSTSLHWMVEQLGGIFSALKELHENNYRHGDLRPETILWCRDSSNNEILQIADLDFGMYSSERDIDGIEVKAPTGVPRYRPPERDPPQPLPFWSADPSTHSTPDARSLQHDMWSMGCVTLEMLLWLVCGNESLKTFESNTYRFWDYGDRQDTPYTINSYVASCISVMMSQLPDNTAYKDILMLVKERLLVVAVSDEYTSSKAHREIAVVLCEKMSEIQQKCRLSETYLAPLQFPYPSDIIRDHVRPIEWPLNVHSIRHNPGPRPTN